MAFVRDAILRLVTGGQIKDVAELQKRLDDNSAGIERWAEAPKDFWALKNHDALPTPSNDLETSYGAVVIVVSGKLYVRQADKTYQLVGSQT